MFWDSDIDCSPATETYHTPYRLASFAGGQEPSGINSWTLSVKENNCGCKSGYHLLLLLLPPINTCVPQKTFVDWWLSQTRVRLTDMNNPGCPRVLVCAACSFCSSSGLQRIMRTCENKKTTTEDGGWQYEGDRTVQYQGTKNK